jgi:predicted nucleic acid-binding Zn ribbon protein
MNTLAIKSGGNLILWRNRGSYDINVIKENQKEKLISETQRLKANDILWLLLFILITLSIEWLLRKYFALN